MFNFLTITSSYFCRNITSHDIKHSFLHRCKFYHVFPSITLTFVSLQVQLLSFTTSQHNLIFLHLQLPFRSGFMVEKNMPLKWDISSLMVIDEATGTPHARCVFSHAMYSSPCACSVPCPFPVGVSFQYAAVVMIPACETSIFSHQFTFPQHVLLLDDCMNTTFHTDVAFTPKVPAVVDFFFHVLCLESLISPLHIFSELFEPSTVVLLSSCFSCFL